MKKSIRKMQIVFCILILILFIFFSFLNLKAAETINPDNYIVLIGRVESLTGEAVIISETGEEKELKQGDLIYSDKVVEYVENIDDRNFVDDGFKKIEEKYVLKTNPDTELKIILNDFQNENGNLTIGAESEIEVVIKGGCYYASDYDCEGFNYDTLRWRHKKKEFNLKINSGTGRFVYRPNDSCYLHVETDNFNKDSNYRLIGDKPLDFEVEVRAKEVDERAVAQKEEIKQGIKDSIEVILLAYDAESVKDLDENIRVVVEKQIADLEAYYNEIDDSDIYFGPEEVSNIITTVRVYQSQFKYQGETFSAGEMLVIKD